MTLLARPTATWELASSSSTSSCVACSSSSGATTRLTSPMRSASAASISRAVMISSLARPSPTTAGRRVDPPTSGMIPNFTSGRPRVLSLEAILQVASEGHLQGSPHACPVDLADDRLGHLFADVRAVQEDAAEGTQDAGLPGEAGELREVHPRREHGPLATQHHAMDLLVRGRRVQGAPELAQELLVHGIALLRAVEHYVPDRSTILCDDDAHLAAPDVVIALGRSGG